MVKNTIRVEKSTVHEVISARTLFSLNCLKTLWFATHKYHEALQLSGLGRFSKRSAFD